MEIKIMSDWDELKARYGSKRQYLNRKIALTGYQWEDFKNYLIDLGADIFSECAQNEMFRFKLNGQLGIVYEKHSGNLLAHNLGAEYNRLIGQDSMELYLKDCYYNKV